MEYYDAKDKLRRAAQDEQATRLRPPGFAPDIEGAPATPMPRPSGEDVVRTAKGAGGYEFAELADGSFKILQSPTSNLGKIVRPGMRGYDDIKSEMSRSAAPRPAPRRAPVEEDIFADAGIQGPIEYASDLEASLPAPFEQEMLQVPGPSADKDLTDAFLRMGHNPDVARTNAKALLAAYQKSGNDQSMARAIQSIINTRVAR